MSGDFADPDPVRCRYYAGFMSHLGRLQFDVSYWTLFFLVILMLFLSSWKYGSSVEKAAALQVGSHAHRHTMKQCMYVCAACAAVSITAVVFEVFSLLALEFCDGEDLMSLYWSTWTVLQVGGVVAELGILLAGWNTIRGNKNPPWALALGTPVLVVAGLGHAMHLAMKKRVKKVKEVSRSRSRSRHRHRHRHRDDDSSYPTLPISRDGTLRVDASDSEAQKQPSPLMPPSPAASSAQYSARLIGYTVEGAPILQFLENPGDVAPRRGDLLGRNADGLLTVAFKKTMTVLMPDSPDDAGRNRQTHDSDQEMGEVGVFSPENGGGNNSPRRPSRQVVRIQTIEEQESSGRSSLT